MADQKTPPALVLSIVSLTGIVSFAQARGVLVLAVDDNAQEDLAEWIDLRQKQGYEVAVHKVPRGATATVLGLIEQEHEKNHGLSGVLLIGSDSALPMFREPDHRIQRYEPDLLLLTDDPYGIPDATGVPAIPVGRIPADDRETLRRLASKIVRYERQLSQLRPQVFVLAGREPASEEPVALGVSPQDLADQFFRVFISELDLALPLLEFQVRTAFPGPGHYPSEATARVLAEGLSANPLFTVYAGHATRSDLYTYHSPEQAAGLTRDDVRSLDIETVSGPFIMGGCSMLDPEGEGNPIGAELLYLSGGPVAVVGFPRDNDDYCVSQMFELFVDELSRSRQMTLGELVVGVKRALANNPQSPRSRLLEAVMDRNGRLLPRRERVSYARIARKNSRLISLLGDPLITIPLK